MKFIHISDLHLGKRVNEFSMIEDQQYILTKIINIIDEEKPDGILVAGDVYDKTVPSEDAMRLWDDFLNRLSKRQVQVYAISGNHDSAVRFSDHNALVEASGIHLSPVYDGNVKSFVLNDEFGPVNLYLLPFIKPAIVKSRFPEKEIEDYTDACKVAVENMNVNQNERNILVAHQFVIGANPSESEEILVGGLENVNGSIFDAFDYVALGHIHGPQNVGRKTLRYCGSPLKYSFSEKDHEKSVTVIELCDKGNVKVRTVILEPLHDMREIRGTYELLTSRDFYEGTHTEDYIHAVLTDEDGILDAMGRLRVIYPNIMKLSYDNKRTRENRTLQDNVDVQNKSPIELFEEFFETQNNQPMNDEQKALVAKLYKSIWEGN